MEMRISPILVGAVLLALLIGLGAGYFVAASALNTELQKAREGKAMLEEELKAKGTAVPLTPQSGQMAHDLWLIITPLQGGKYAVVILAQGLDQNGAYIIEGVTRGAQMQTVPIAKTVTESEFVPDQRGNGFYWVVLDSDPRQTFEKIELFFLPGMQMERAVLVASANLS